MKTIKHLIVMILLAALTTSGLTIRVDCDCPPGERKSDLRQSGSLMGQSDQKKDRSQYGGSVDPGFIYTVPHREYDWGIHSPIDTLEDYFILPDRDQ